MEGRDSGDRKPDAAKSFRKRRREIFVGAAVAAIFVAGGAWLFARFGAPPPAVVQTKSDIGFADLKKIMSAHPDYEKLDVLRGEREALKAQMAVTLPVAEVQPPKVDEEPFDDSVWQKNAQNVIGRRAEIERRRKKAAEEYRKETEADFKARRDEIDAEYLNVILNLRLKLQNADVLRLTEEDVNILTARLESVQHERGERQFMLNEEREADIMRHADEAVAAQLGDWRADLQESKAQLESEAVKKQAEAQARDVAAMELRMELSRRIQDAMRKKQELIAKDKEIAVLESRIFNDVAGRAAKIAIMHHFTMIVANPAVRLDYLVPLEERIGAAPEKYAKVFGADVNDVTDELIAEMKTVESSEEQMR